ncbi:MAG: HAMP domain-containing protein, partial [Verrucomicrobiota bacterium]
EISRFLERAQQEFLQVLAVGLGAFLFALIPGIYLVNRVTAGLRVIKSALDQFEGGDEKTNVQLNTRDELEDVARSFNEMTSKLAESRENLVNTNISLQHRTNELNQSLTLTNTIMSTVQESLMLITPEGKIEPGYSAAVETMFGRQDVTKMPFVDLVRDRVTGKTYDLTNRFLKLLFNESKTNHLIPKMNPLKEVEVMVEGKNGQMQTKYLSFSFDRVWEDKKVVQSLVTVEDITPRIALTRELKESAERLERQAELLFGIIHVEPKLLNEFIQASRGELDSISSQLSQSIDAESDLSDRQAYFEEQVESIFRCVHRIKGEAALLKISYYEDAAHEFESKLEKLRGKRNLDGNDFVPIVLELSRMIQSFDDMSDVIDKITAMYGGTSPVTPAPKDSTVKSDSPQLDTLAKDLALAHQKQV